MPSFDPIQFIAEKLRDPATGRPFVLYPEQETFLRLALTPDASGALRFRELVFSTPKKNGKTTFGAIVMLVTVFGLGGPDAEGYCLASDEQQAQSRVYQWCRKIVRSSPSLRAACTVTATKITYLPTGATMTALASDEKGAAGVEPTAAEFDELWTYDAERLARLFDEMIPIPTKKISIRLTTTHAGFSDSSPVLQRLYERGLRGVQVQPDLYQSDGMLMFWTNRNCAPWITESWLRDAEQQLRPAQYARMIRNEWVSSTSSFIDPAEWDACAVGRPLLSDNTQPVWVGLDASLSRDASAMAAVMYDAADQRIRLVWHRIWQPTKKDRLQFEATIGTAICELMTRFQVRKIRYDPYQLEFKSQDLRAAGVPMSKYDQTPENLTKMGTLLFDLIRGRNLLAYPDAALRTAITQAAVQETARGLKIAKLKQKHRIDIVVALAMACMGAAEEGPHRRPQFVRLVGW